MARELNLTTQKQEFMKESYLKEIHTRINWWHHYRQNLQPVPHLVSKPKVKNHFKLPTIIHSSIEANIDNKNCLDIHQDVHNPREGRNSDEMKTGLMESQMKPVSPGTRSLLYQGTSKEEKGRHRYLKARNILGPEEKYCFPVTTSWDYGWRLGTIIGLHMTLIQQSC
ncbi:protein SPMIP1 isoform X2 [Rhinoderma darwinii]|uniref:protein SPMIP1 isoform X2 n=1 Tax=Rhinoderma darwinii TaxID=43563 RepID=UPI003F66F69D